MTPNMWTSVTLGQTLLVSGAFVALVGSSAIAGDCPVACPGGDDTVLASDGCEDAKLDSNGGCNQDPLAPPYDLLGTLTESNPTVTYCGQVGTVLPDARDLDWAIFTLDQPAFIDITVSHQVIATGEPAPNFTIFLRNGSDCATAIDVIGAASGACPFVPAQVFLPAGTHTFIVTVNAFGADGPLCPVDYVATISATFGANEVCGDEAAGDCGEANGTPGCDDFACCEAVCAFLTDCCDVAWDLTCVEFAIDPEFCGLFIYECPDAPGAPANDCVADALEVFTDSSLPFDTTAATTDGPPQAECNSDMNDLPIWRDIWYYWIATDDGFFTASNCLTAEFDSKIAIYNLGSDLPSAIDGQFLPSFFVACNEDCPDPQFFTSELTIEVSEGDVYLVRLGGYQNAAGDGTIAFTFAPLEEPDTCDNPGSDPLTQSNDPIGTGGQVACAGGGVTTANQFARSFNLAVGPTAGSDYLLNCVDFSYLNTGPSVFGTINVYIDENGGAPTSVFVDLLPIGSRTVFLPNSAVTNIFATFEEPLCVPANSVLVIEIDFPAQVGPAPSALRIGGNTAGTTGVTYFKTGGPCGLTDYIDPATIGFPATNWAMTLLGTIGCEDKPTPCPADLNGDGIVDGADFGLLSLNWGNPGTGDLNGDGNVDGADAGLLSLSWGPCPK